MSVSENKETKVEPKLKSSYSIRRDGQEANPGISVIPESVTINDFTTSASNLFIDASGEESTAYSFREWMNEKTKRAKAQAFGLCSALKEKSLDAKRAVYAESAGNFGATASLADIQVKVTYDIEVWEDMCNYPNVSHYQAAYILQARQDLARYNYDLSELPNLTPIDDEVYVYVVCSSGVISIDDVLQADADEDVNDKVAEVGCFCAYPFTGSKTIATATLDDISEAMSNAVATSESISAMADTIAEDYEATKEEVANQKSSLIDNLTTKCLTASSIAMSIIDPVRRDLQNENLSVREKVRSVMKACGLTPDGSDPNNVLDPVPNSLSGMTGSSPLLLFGDQVVDNFTNIDWSSIGSGLKGIWDGICKTTSLAFSGISKGIGKVAHKIEAATTNADDIYIVSKKQDPVINNFGWGFKLNPDNTPSWYLDVLSTNEYLVFSAPSAKIYLYKDSNDVVKGIIKFSCARTQNNSNMNPFTQSLVCTVPDNVLNSQYIADCAAKFENLVGTTTDPTSDNAAYEAINASKADFAAWGSALMLWSYSPVMLKAFTNYSGNDAAGLMNNFQTRFPLYNLDDPSKLINLFDRDGNYINVPGSAPANPTNTQLVKEACYFAETGFYDGEYTVNYPGTVSWSQDQTKPYVTFTGESFLQGLVDTLLRIAAGNWVVDTGHAQIDMSAYKGITYVPYYHSNSSCDGRYAIKTDSDNAKAYANMLAAFAITGAIIIVGGVLLRRKLTARSRAYALERQLNHDNYQVECALGNDPSAISSCFGAAGITDVELDDDGNPCNKKQIAKMLKFWAKQDKKKSKKLARLQKLIGAVPSGSSVESLSSSVQSKMSGTSIDINQLYESVTGESVS